MPPTPPARLDLASLPTKVRLLERASTAFGASLWVKHDDETGSVLSGNKVRKLQYAVREALDQGADTLITCGGLQSNHCRTTAAMARRAGLDVHLLLRGQGDAPLVGNYLLDTLLGATIHFVTPEQYRDHDRLMAELAGKLQERGHRPYVIAEGCSMPIGSWGYIEAAQEIAAAQEQLGIGFDAIVHAVGSGGTSAGLELGVRLAGLQANVWGVNVCDDASTFQRSIAALANITAERFGLPVERLAPSDIRMLDGYVGRGYGMTQPVELERLRDAAHQEGLVLDPVYTGKAWHALWRERARFADARHVLFIHTGGVFGLFAHAAELESVCTGP